MYQALFGILSFLYIASLPVLILQMFKKVKNKKIPESKIDNKIQNFNNTLALITIVVNVIMFTIFYYGNLSLRSNVLSTAGMLAILSFPILTVLYWFIQKKLYKLAKEIYINSEFFPYLKFNYILLSAISAVTVFMFIAWIMNLFN